VLQDTTQVQGKGGHLSSGVRVYLFSTLQNPTKIKSGGQHFKLQDLHFPYMYNCFSYPIKKTIEFMPPLKPIQITTISLKKNHECTYISSFLVAKTGRSQSNAGVLHLPAGCNPMQELHLSASSDFYFIL